MGILISIEQIPLNKQQIFEVFVATRSSITRLTSHIYNYVIVLRQNTTISISNPISKSDYLFKIPHYINPKFCFLNVKFCLLKLVHIGLFNFTLRSKERKVYTKNHHVFEDGYHSKQHNLQATKGERGCHRDDYWNNHLGVRILHK